jgi:uncharacterized membrane protein YoaT (DUF817 family)
MHNSKQLVLQLLKETVVFAGLSGTIIVLHRHNLALLAVLCLVLAVVLTQWHRRSDVVCLIVIAVFGTMAEAAFVRFGVWQYANPSCFGMPVWFPIALGLAGLVGQRLTRSITALWARVADREASPKTFRRA